MDVPAFSVWDESIHFLSDQQKRLANAQKADVSPSSVDRVNQRAEFPGSAKVPYQTTLENCTCRDFTVRKLPCKHIYRLAMECGIIHTDFKSGTNKNTVLAEAFSLAEMIDEIEKLNESAQQEMSAFMSNDKAVEGYCHVFNDASLDDALFNCALIEEIPTPISDYLRGMKKDDIAGMLAKLGIECQGKKKAELVDICEKNRDKVCSLFPPIHTFVLAEKAKARSGKACTYIKRKYEMVEKFDCDDGFYVCPYGARRSAINPNMCYFPDDEITKLLTKYGCNRCLNGYDISSQLETVQ